MRTVASQTQPGSADVIHACRELLTRLPCAAALWFGHRETGSLNPPAMRLLGFDDPTVSRALWLSRVDPRDQDQFRSSWRRLADRDGSMCSDYRFTRGDGKRVWLRELASPYREAGGDADAIISAYIDVSDLKERRDRPREAWSAAQLEAILGPLIHDVRNSLHAIRLEIDLCLADLGEAFGSDRFFESIDRVTRSLSDLREYLVRPNGELAPAGLEMILADVVSQMRGELESRGITVTVNRPAAASRVLTNDKQLRYALERIVDVCAVLLHGGGRLTVDTARRDAEYLELTFTVESSTVLEIEEKEAFRPFVKIHHRSLGLGMAVARQIVERHHGAITFTKPSPQSGRISIRLKRCDTDG